MDEIIEKLDEEELWTYELKSSRISSAERAVISRRRFRYPNRAMSVSSFDRLGKIRRTMSFRGHGAFEE